MPMRVIEENAPVTGRVDEYGFPIIEPRVQEMISVEELVGGYRPLGNGYYSRSPKIKQQKAVLAAAKQAEGGDLIVTLDSLVAIAAQLLFVQDENGDAFRPATVDEIEDTFDAQELQALITRNTGMAPSGDNPKN